MAKSKQSKQETLKLLTDKLSKAKSLVFANFDGLKVKEADELRKKFRKEGIDFLAAKKTLIKIAFKKAGLNIDPKTFERGVAIAFNYEDEVIAARIIEEFSKEHQALQSIGGVLENKFIDKAKIIELSKLPTRAELIAKAVGSIAAPLSGLVNVLRGNIRCLVYTLKAIQDKKAN